MVSWITLGRTADSPIQPSHCVAGATHPLKGCPEVGVTCCARNLAEIERGKEWGSKIGTFFYKTHSAY